MRLTRYFAPKLIAVLSLSLAAFAQQADQDDTPDPDSASRGVARISILNGDVSIRRGDSGDFVAAAINAPLVVGDRVITGANSRAEVQFDWANFIRIGADSEIRLSELGNRRYQIQMARGVATFRVLRESEADVEVSTPQVSIRPAKQGIYRMAVYEDGRSEVTVRSGEIEVFTPRGVETLRSGRTMQVRGTASDPEYQIVNANREDDWDRWNKNRDRDLEQSASYKYVHRDIYGAEDLDNYGRWVNDSSYGYVWSPRVAVGWAPYRSGRWAWIDWYGWSWVSYDPWGWAPYHYGRWYQSASYGWCWYPGNLGYGRRHYWSPGLVAFVGFGGGGIGFGFNHIGWVPLAPYERYNRWYGRGYYGGNRNFNNTTIVNNVNIYNNYRNARINNAVTTIDGAGFARGGSGRAWRSSDGDFQRASLVRGQLPVTPGRESLRLSDREVRGVSSRTSDNERFFSRRQPAQVERVPFEQQRRNIEQTSVRGGETPRVGSASGFAQGSSGQEVIRREEQPRRTVQAPGQDSSADRQNGWRRFGEPVNGTADHIDRSRPSVRESGNGAGVQGGWSRFGEPSATRNDTVDRGTVDRNATRSLQPSRTESQPQSQQTERSVRENSDGWRRFERSTTPAPDASSQRTFGNRIERSDPAPSVDRSNTNRFERPSSIDRNGGFRGGSSPESVRISPPMVRERSAPRMESGPAMRERSSPRSESGPAMRERSAPRSESAPSGGGARNSGGGGGGRSETRGGGGRGR